MSALAGQIRDLLSANTTLTNLLTGGIYADFEISRQGTPEAYDENKELRPCAVARVSTETQAGPFQRGSRAIVEIYFYQRSGYDRIDVAMLTVFNLLNMTKIDGGVWEVRWSDDIPDTQDTALQYSLAVSRYQVTRLR